ncbi:helix-turn-helix domain-containing protein [Enterobacteriaceae bacterium 4M9]|nr:helix-turn-helix domain-containing protein [Enterobacteriaceae bacterium 4M9]
MNNLEKMRKVGEEVYGSSWQSSLARALGISDRTVRNFISGKSNIPETLSSRLLSAMDVEIEKIQRAIAIIESDAVSGDDVTTEVITGIVDRYEYSDEMARQHAVDAVNNAVYPKTFLSDLDAVARKYSE